LAVTALFQSSHKGATVQAERPLVKADPAYTIWQDEIQTLSENTKKLYKEYFDKFLEYTGKTADQLLQARILETASQDKVTKRRAETTFKSFLTTMRQFYKPKTMQNIYASVRSFYEAHEYPLIMKKRDYPKGDGIGQLRATPEATKAIFEKANTPLKALISTINDTGLGVSDIRHLKASLILENPEAQIIHIRMIRQKTGDRIHTFLGEESIKLLKDYLNLRRRHRKNNTRNNNARKPTIPNMATRTTENTHTKQPLKPNSSSLQPRRIQTHERTLIQKETPNSP
jgi:site-specific recombinase XerD